MQRSDSGNGSRQGGGAGVTSECEVELAPQSEVPPSAESPELPDEVGLDEEALATWRVIKETFPIIAGDELLAAHTKPPEMLVEDLLEEGSLTMISGTWGSGKTATLLSCGIAVARGREFAGSLRALKAGGVLVLGLETSPYQYAKQYRRLLAGQDLEALAGVDFITSSKASVSDKRMAILLRERIIRGEYDLILLDSLKAISTEDENDNAAMGKVMTWLVDLCREGLTVAFTHHTVKPNGTAREARFNSRGASSIPAYCDMEWRAQLADHDLTLECLKSRGGVDLFKKHYLRMEWDSASIRLRPADTEQLEAVISTALQGAGEEGLRKGLLVSTAETHFTAVTRLALDERVERVLERLKRAGKVSHAGQGKPYVWMK